MLENLQWFGHASFKISGEKNIYIDPWKLGEEEPADIILISHEHYDHCSLDDVSKIRKEDTVIITTGACANQLSGDVRLLKPGESVEIGPVKIEAVPSYNIGKSFHPKERGYLGFIITADDGTRYYYAGDTDAIPEMSDIEADVALLPVGGTYTMDACEAADAVGRMHIKAVVPYHYGDIVGSQKDAEEFQRLCGVEVHILRPS
jgi:L-ascorbate metabolism protein UlaG (beta-lactamase superfamily)